MIGDIKHIIVIESLSEKDGVNYTGEALYKDYIQRRIELYQKDFVHKFHKVSTTNEFVELLNYYIFNATYMQGGILIHLEMHGDENKNGLILSNRNLIKWELLVDLFRQINIISNNKLFITLGTCFGRFLFKGIDPYKKSPYSGFISASIAVDPEEVYIKFGKLFEELIDKGNIVDAYLEMEKTESNFYYKDSERVFEEVYKMTLEELKDDETIKTKMIQNAVSRMKKDIKGGEISEDETDEIFEIVLKDMFYKQRQAFDFNDENSGL